MSQPCQCGQSFTFTPDGFFQGNIFIAQGVSATGFGKALHQRLSTCFQKYEFYLDAFVDHFELPGQNSNVLAAAHIDGDRNVSVLLRLQVVDENDKQ